MTDRPRLRIVDTTLRDGSHAIAHQFTVDQVTTIAGALDQAGVWAIAVGHGDGLGANSLQYGRPLHTDEELLRAAAAVIQQAEIAVAILPGIGTKQDLERARDGRRHRRPGLHRRAPRPTSACSTSASRASSA